jgi:hypothetical protein
MSAEANLSVTDSWQSMLAEISPGWEDGEAADRLGAAAVGIAVTILKTGRIDRRSLRPFSVDELATAEDRLRENGYIGERDDGGPLILWEADTDIGDGIAWSLLAAVGCGYLAREPEST